MRNVVLACALSLVATSFLAPDPADAAPRKSKNKAKIVRVASADTYYYSGASQLYDNSRSFFGSPVRGFEFFRQNADRATQ